MASESEATCEEDPNFAVICAFFEKFGQLIGITDVDFLELQSMLENTHEVSKFLSELHIKLLRKIKKNVSPEKWEKTLVKFCHSFSNVDAWELERFGYKKAQLSSKVRVLKELLEAQFDLNTKFKVEINKLTANDLRSQPLGRDKFGHAYWFQSDDNYQIRVYKEDLDDEKWTLVAKDRTGLVSLISNLSDGDIKISSDSAGNEDSNSLSEKPIIDTGQQDTDSKRTSEDEESNLMAINGDREKENEEEECDNKDEEAEIEESSEKPLDDEKEEKIKNKIEKESQMSPVNKEEKETGDEKKEESDTNKKTENCENEELKPGTKRPREDSDDSDTLSPKHKIKNINSDDVKEAVVGEAIEEAVMKIEGEGSGADNQCPIIGDVVEEEIIYFYGSGSGFDCQTGTNSDNESSDIQTDKTEIKSANEESNSASVDTIQKENGGESDNKCLSKASENNLSKNSSNIEENVKEQPKDTIQVEEGKTELDVNNLSDKIEAQEPVCVKRIAYVCGEEESKKLIIEENGKEIIENEIEGKSIEQTANNGTEETEKLIEKQEKCAEEEASLEFADTKQVTEESPKEEEVPLVVSPQDRPKKKAVKSAQRKNDKTEETEKGDEKENTAESSVTNSPQLSNDNSVLEPADVGAHPISVLENDDSEVKTTSTKPTLTTFSLDFNDPLTPTPIENPSPLRALRKRGLNVVSTKPPEPDDGKRLKLKGRRPIDAALRRSVEQRIEQLHGSSSDSKESDTEQQTKTKKGGRFVKKKSPKNDGNEHSKSNSPKTVPKKNPEKKYSRMLAGLKIEEEDSNDRPLRQSRRIAQLKIKEQAKPAKQIAQEAREKQKLNEQTDKRKKAKAETDEDEDSESEDKKSGKKKKKKKEKPVMFNEKRPWQSSSEDSEDAAEEEEEEIIEEEDDAPLGPLQSDHEFSPESEEEDEEWTPLKRARTARKESDPEQIDDFPCQKCIKSDHPEWILLCDKCDNGWHCSCLRPPLLVIPEGDWFCPPCEHIILLERLQVKLVEYDKKLSKKEIEDRRKERLAYVGISLNNVLPSKEPSDHRKKKKRRHSSEEASETSYESESESEDSDEPIYQLRQRRQTKSYKFNEYDELLKDAIGEDIGKTEDSAGNLGRGKDIQTIVKGLEEEKEEEKKAKEEAKKVEERPTTANLKKMLRKKHRKLNSLDFDSEEEDISDEDFKGSSNSESEEEEDYASEESEDSDDYVGKKRRKNAPIRRSTRARTRKLDKDFINDDSEDDAPRKKKKKSIWDESESDESDLSGYGKRKSKKKKKDSNNAKSGLKNRRIQYGGLSSSEEENFGKGRRTRGKKATYVDTLATDDSEEEESVTKKNPRRIVSDDDHDEDFVANEEDEVEDEKDSEEKGEDEEEEEEDGEEEYDSEEEERRKKLPLIVPKIYIKKPLGAKKEIPQGTKPIPTDLQEDESTKKSEKPLKMIRPSAVEKEFEAHKPKTTESIKEILKSNIEARLNEASLKKIDSDELEMYPSEPKQQKCELLAAALKVPPKKSTLHEPIVSNVSALIKNDSENDDLSEPPGIALPMFEELGSDSSDSLKKRKGRPAKKKIDENSGKNEPAIEIAAPPQPFSQAQPTPSVITRMLQSKPGISIYPVGRIRPKQFATMRDDDSDESSPKNSPTSSPAVARMSQYSMPVAPPPSRGAVSPMPYRHHGPPGMNHYPRGPPPAGIRGPPAFVHHRPPLGPSPSVSGPINLSEQGQPRGGPPINRYSTPPPVSQAPPGPRPPLHLYRPPITNNGPPYVPPVSTNGPPHQPYTAPTSGSGSQVQPYVPPVSSNNGQPPYPPPVPPGPSSQPPYPAAHAGATDNEAAPSPAQTPSEGYYGSYPSAVGGGEEDLPPPSTYEGLPPETGSSYQEPYANEDRSPANPSDGSNVKNYEEESGGEFAGLASYFSSQREDDLES